MGCVFCINKEELLDKQSAQVVHSLPTIDEDLGEYGMPKFNPPIPRNHQDLFIQYVDTCEGKSIQPSENSTVELNFSGWVLEEGELWSQESEGVIRRMTTLFDPKRKALTSIRLKQNTISMMERFVTLTAIDKKSNASPKSTDSPKNLKMSTVYGGCYEYTENWEVQLGANEIFKGLEDIILKMSVGDEVIAFIPSKLAYIKESVDTGMEAESIDTRIEANADLVVKVYLKSIVK